jgi:hypothetical protein
MCWAFTMTKRRESAATTLTMKRPSRLRERSGATVRKLPVVRAVTALCVVSVALLLLLAYGSITSRHERDKEQSNVGSVQINLPKFVPFHGPSPKHTNSSLARFTDKQAQENAEVVQEKRRLYYLDKLCQSRNETATVDWFVPAQAQLSSDTAIVPAAAAASKPCLFTLLDLGANVGDSLGKFIDAGIDADCTGRYSVTEGRIRPLTDHSINELTTWTRNTMEKFAATHAHRHTKDMDKHSLAQPENYCYFGLEGNPAFTDRLQQLQQRVLATTPRPLRSVRFLTETVATGTGDGPTSLYLDTVNGKNNFFGSSLLIDHHDVRQSAAKQADGAPVAASVQGVTLSTLLKETVVRQAGAHVIVKIDIEGAEYALLNEAYNSGVLCEYAASGVRVDVRMEIHPKVK